MTTFGVIPHHGPVDGMTLAEQTGRRLLFAGIGWDDPGLRAIREWNARAYERAGLPSPHDPDPDDLDDPALD